MLTGNYRINDVVMEVSPNTSWDHQIIKDGLNGLPINSSYQMHRWTFSELDGSTFEAILAIFEAQQSDNAQPASLETDAHYVALSTTDDYFTQEYTDFVIKSVDPRTRGLPRYEGVNIQFEVYVG